MPEHADRHKIKYTGSAGKRLWCVAVLLIVTPTVFGIGLMRRGYYVWSSGFPIL